MSQLSLELSSLSNLSVYIHVPFCDSLCDFCAFSKVTSNPLTIDRYVSAVGKEIDLFCKTYGIDIKNRIRTCYFGGGSPSVLTSHQIGQILERINLGAVSELTIECHPDHLTENYLRELISIGFNRISVGIENTEDELLRSIGRKPHIRNLKQISELFRKFNFVNWSMDLMFGYSTMSLIKFSKMLDTVLELEFPPAHVSLYAITLEPGTPLFYRKDFKVHDDLIVYYELIENKMTTAGYINEEISNWHKPTHGSIHNQNYWNSGNWVGFGPGAYSTITNRRWFNTKKVDSYLTKVESNILPIAHGELISENDRKFESLMLSLRTPKGVEASYLPDELVDEGLIKVDENTRRYVLTGAGKAMSNYVCGKILI